ncbi:DUF6308 family protein [Allokutzneria albata]|uniref:Uncharacterized protein n=1 Tax=Allokutzneria albata TaxID=211114 RepID=A0A1G9UU91_ALLAB|nr:DUF6308 family protein [Allokutzneria albata]SDM63438.1 hypothetical protein SAMN04489726_2628 [Allokutzneria albata]
MDGYGWAHGVLDEAVLGGAAAGDIRHYVASLTARRYERLEGDGAERPDAFTPADIAATMSLSLPWHGVAALECLWSRVDQLNDLLAEVAHTPMHDAPAAAYAPDGPVDRLWQALTETPGIAAPVAGKLLARKRPHHVPVYDPVVLDVLGWPEDFWQCLHSWFAADPGRAGQVAQVRADAGMHEGTSLLRCVDIALWMFAKRLNVASSAPGSVI